MKPFMRMNQTFEKVVDSMFLGAQKRLQKTVTAKFHILANLFEKWAPRKRKTVTETLEVFLELFWISQHLISLQQLMFPPADVITIIKEWKRSPLAPLCQSQAGAYIFTLLDLRQFV